MNSVAFICSYSSDSRYELTIDLETTLDERQRVIVYSSLEFLTLTVL